MSQEKIKDEPSSPNTYAGFVSLIGVPNAGKSTFLNRVIGQKLAIVTPKVQTTRTRIIGIKNINFSQIIFVDIPGIIKPRGNLNHSMMDIAWSSIKESDLHILLVDCAKKQEQIIEENKLIFDTLGDEIKKTILVINKIDKLDKNKLFKIVDNFSKHFNFLSVFMISSLNGDGVKDLLNFLEKNIPKSQWLYPEEHVTDTSLRELASEITREKLFLSLNEELPYSLTVKTDEWKEGEKNKLIVSQTIYVKKKNQKVIIIGKGGEKIKEVGTSSRKAIEKMTQRKIFLKLYVKVKKNWDLNLKS